MFSFPEMCSPFNLSKCEFANAKQQGEVNLIQVSRWINESFPVLTAAATCPENDLPAIAGFSSFA